ncbi:hypothetical protein P7K49_011201 [Saguinus oedipus]|uniref:Uncharacterized protein n=1 Tax=Saguinus oedipus TaxID=9490 RepID=A0ABQ9VPZ7_SAGOE|nr:hypothetical protein P7K49_011201 [Saguinus oedipus]
MLAEGVAVAKVKGDTLYGHVMTSEHLHKKYDFDTHLLTEARILDFQETHDVQLQVAKLDSLVNMMTTANQSGLQALGLAIRSVRLGGHLTQVDTRDVAPSGPRRASSRGPGTQHPRWGGRSGCAAGQVPKAGAAPASHSATEPWPQLHKGTVSV